MSLINTMLNDIDQRNIGMASPEISAQVRSVIQPMAKTNTALWLAMGAAFLVLAAAAFWYLNSVRQHQAVVRPITVTQTAAPLTKPVAYVAPAAVAQAVEPAASSVEIEKPVVQADAIAANSKVAIADTTQAVPAPTKTSAPIAKPTKSVADKPIADKTTLDKPATDSATQLVATADAKTPAEDKALAKPTTKAAQAANAQRKATTHLAVKELTPKQQANARYNQALALIQQGRVAEAREYLQRILDNTPDHHDARQLLASLLIEGGRNQEAATVLKKGLEVAPHNSTFAATLARLQVEFGDTQSALQTLEQNLAGVDAQDADYYALMAALLQRENRHEETVKYYMEALRVRPATPNWLIGVGISLQAMNHWQEAEAAYQRAIETGNLSADLAEFASQQMKAMRNRS